MFHLLTAALINTLIKHMVSCGIVLVFQWVEKLWVKLKSLIWWLDLFSLYDRKSGSDKGKVSPQVYPDISEIDH